MSNLFCSNCKIDLNNNQEIKDHYKSEFHRYNIKRQLVSLPPLTLEEFHKKKQAVQDVQNKEKESMLKCKVCSKTFGTKSTYDQHINSIKHKENVKHEENSEKKNKIILEQDAQLQEEIQMQKVNRKKPITTMDNQKVCLFCNAESPSIDENLIHMRANHSFFISDIKYVTNLEGLLKYLGEKIQKGCLCIYCENKQTKDFKSGDAVQKHMMDKGHCFMKNDDYDEYIKYYDFTPTLHEYKAKFGNVDQEEEKEKLAANEAYFEIVSDGEANEEENEWEDEDEDEDEDGENDEDYEELDENEDRSDDENKKETAIKDQELNEENKKKPRIHRIKVKKAVVLPSGEVELPNGKIIGHREYKIYYKQFFRSATAQGHLKALMPNYSQSRQLSLLNNQNQLMLVNKLNEVKTKQKQDKINRKYLHKQHHDFMKLGIQSNKLQHYFVQQCPLQNHS